MLFLFWRVPPPFRNGEGDAPHTPQPCFSFFNVYRHPLSTANGPLRTRHNLAFLFWRVPPLSRNGEVGAPYTPQPRFSFLACTAALSQRRSGHSAHATTLLFFFGVYRHPFGTAKWPLRTRHNLAFLFWRVPPPFRNGEVDAPHTLIHSFFENIPYQLINRLRIHWVVKRFKGVYNIIALIISILRIMIYLR